MKAYLDALVNYAADCGLIEDEDKVYAFNRLLELMELDSADGEGTVSAPLNEILDALCDDACRRGILDDNIVARDLFDTRLMGALTPFPHEVRRKFSELYSQSPECATDWYYQFSQDTNYIRRDRIKKDRKWTYDCEYGSIDITINLSKPEKDPKAIAAAKLKKGDLCVVGCSSSEIVGENIGKGSVFEVGQAVFDGIYGVLKQNGIYLGCQCCEHLNRAVVVEGEYAAAHGLEEVNAGPQPKAGGSWATAGYRAFEKPTVVEKVRADAGIDIGDTLIGMHLKEVAVPVRLAVRQIGQANVVCARTRPKFIGGCRAVYDEEKM